MTVAIKNAPGVTDKPLARVGKEEIKINNSTPVIKTSEYIQEIEELARMNAVTGYGDIAVLNRINSISKKYGLDQNKVFMDIKKVKL